MLNSYQLLDEYHSCPRGHGHIPLHIPISANTHPLLVPTLVTFRLVHQYTHVIDKQLTWRSTWTPVIMSWFNWTNHFLVTMMASWNWPSPVWAHLNTCDDHLLGIPCSMPKVSSMTNLWKDLQDDRVTSSSSTWTTAIAQTMVSNVQNLLNCGGQSIQETCAAT